MFVIELDGHGVRLGLEDVRYFAEWMAEHETEQVVARTQVGNVEVCTDFLGTDLDHGRDRDSRMPLCYETMVFGPRGPLDQRTRRYRTRTDALSGHAAVVAELQR